MPVPSSRAPAEVYRRLLRAFGRQGWWPVSARGPVAAYRPGVWGRLTERQRLEVCVGAILAQNTNWNNAAAAVAALNGAGMMEAGRLLRAPARRLAALIRPSGYFRQKAKKLKSFALRLKARGGHLGRWLAGAAAPPCRSPSGKALATGLAGAAAPPCRSLAALREDVLGVWGVGPETADSILLYAGGRPSFVVDAYTLRVGSRVGWFRKATYDRVQRFMARGLPVDARLYGEYHALIVELAKRHCRATPACPGCPLLDICRHGRAHA